MQRQRNVTDLAVRSLASYRLLPKTATWNPRELWQSLEPELRDLVADARVPVLEVF